MLIDSYIVKTSKGQISWKKTFENLFRIFSIQNEPVETEFACPLCSKPIMMASSEIFCSDDTCKFNPTMIDLIAKCYEYIEE